MINDPIFEIKEEENKKDYVKFIISPLEQGYGNTIGNALRRVLLSSIPGAAITNVRIQGVKHQFSTLKGMKEDVVEFLLNLKKVRLIYSGEKPTKLSIFATEQGEVKASDIKTDADVKIVNGNLVLANLAKDAKLEAKMEAEVGVGYSPGEDRTTNEIGLIPLDASFSPITRINFKVEETRVGRYTNYDKLIFEVWTDETIDPKKALITASEILVKYFNQIISPKKVEKKEEEKKDELGPIGKLSVEEIGLPTRVANALVKAGYETIEDLVVAKREDLVKVRNLGEKSVKIIDAALGEKGLSLIEK
ncbi:DNA-directed RNA polymerase subunit alpha [Candidatus Woesebacteria bacterium RBG_13_34_9]|uniref:DNA-directed RNA polymerase subunit alpha n=1 Tax=Candidatus Woesebacteria bacterium RBG_13_34_9 TaxID=1802477 RepID=A0A1F7X2Y0_9BACT|nr:MAG: DNA-directed RNA polymerase subunit alpha [Candidatus Woesebacteria bacterium RBG_13_34_9]